MDCVSEIGGCPIKNPLTAQLMIRPLAHGVIFSPVLLAGFGYRDGAA
jgi:hypothetical protein